MTPLSIVYWLYQGDEALSRGPRQYTVAHVNAQLPMLAAHCRVPYRVMCITEDAAGLDGSIHVVAPPVVSDGPVLPRDPRFPRCYRRLWNFSAEARDVLGEKILALDLDTLIVSDITPLVARGDLPLIVWRAPSGLFLGAAYLLHTGMQTHIWERFDFSQSPLALRAAHYQESDQGWLNHLLPAGTPAWTERDGMYLPPLGDPRPLPPSARIVSFGGPHKPWMTSALPRYPWIAEHYPRII